MNSGFAADLVDHVFNGGGDIGRVQAYFRQLLLARGVGDESVRQAQQTNQ